MELNYTRLQLPLKRKPSKKKVIILLGLSLAVLVLLIYLGKNYFVKRSSQEVDIEKISDDVAAVEIDDSGSSGLKAAVGKALNNATATYAIAIKNLKTDEFYYLNGHRQFNAASLYKLWVMASTYEQIEKGRVNEDDLMRQEVSVLNEKFKIATEEAEMTEGEVEMSVRGALERMITASDNYSALLLTEKIGIRAVTDFLSFYEFNNSSFGQPPKTTAYDAALFFEKLYNGQLASQENTTKMIDLLKGQALNQVLPKYLPEATVVAHKTGDLNPVAHDAGIVYAEKGDYVIVILSESSNPLGAKERIAEISQAVYEYFSQ